MADMSTGKVLALVVGTLRRLGIINSAGVFTAVTPVTVDWTSYTPGCSWNSGCTVTGEYRVVDGGETIELRFNITCSGAVGPGATSLTLDLPAGYTARLGSDGAKNQRIQVSGDMYDADGGSGQIFRMICSATLNDGNTISLIPASETTTGAGEGTGITDTNPYTFAVNDQINLYCRVPLV